MNGFEIDASVAVKWVYEEEFWNNAVLYMKSEVPLYAPELIREEIANAIVKKVRFTDVETRDGWRSYTTLFQSDLLTLIPTHDLFERAYFHAVTLEHALYDCIYLAAAETLDMEIVTADKKFFHCVSEHSQYSSFIRFVDTPPDV